MLAEFVSLHHVDSVRLANASEQWPDGFVKIGEFVHKIEVTSTHGGRRLGKEYRDISEPKLDWDPVENWVQRADAIPHYLEETIAAKSRKNYGSLCWLVVYLNMDEYGIRHRETARVIAEIKARYSANFEAVSILWKGQLY